tara:strand:+ start:352 stop:486 length:135 start_codon:yes stop_codon:yes gene_type:complete
MAQIAVKKFVGASSTSFAVGVKHYVFFPHCQINPNQNQSNKKNA